MQPYFRDAVTSDVPALVAILRDSAEGAVSERPDHLGPYLDALIDIDRTDGSYLLVAELGGEVAAMVHLVAFRHLHECGGRRAEIFSMHVADRFRTTCIGGLLLEHAAERARDLGCRRLLSRCSTARSNDQLFYERHGFVQLDRGFERELMSGQRSVHSVRA